MSPHRPHTRVLLLVVLALTPCAARADPVGFSYSWTIGGGDLSASGAGPISLSQSVAPDGSSVTTNYGGGTATLAVALAGMASATPGEADFFSATPAVIPLGTLTTPALTGSVGTFSFTANNPFTLQLTDTASGQSGSLTLSANTYGNVSPSGTTLGVSASGDPTQSVLLGGHLYTVDGMNTVPDSGPGGTASYVAQVYIDRPAIDFFPPIPVFEAGVSSIGAPEPSSLLLAGSALSLLGGAALRKRRQVRAARAQAASVHLCRSNSANTSPTTTSNPGSTVPPSSVSATVNVRIAVGEV